MAETLSSLADLKGSDVAPAPEAPQYVQKLDKQGRAYATGKRKNAVARVWIKPGKGSVTVNGRPLDVYFARPVLRMILNQPLVVANRLAQYDLMITVAGGGLSGQAGAVRHGLSKALDQLRAGAAPDAQEGRLSDARFPRRRAQEIRPQEGSRELPVLQALTAAVAGERAASAAFPLTRPSKRAPPPIDRGRFFGHSRAGRAGPARRAGKRDSPGGSAGRPRPPCDRPCQGDLPCCAAFSPSPGVRRSPARPS